MAGETGDVGGQGEQAVGEISGEAVEFGVILVFRVV